MRLGVFGGSFDPIHYGHLLLAECCREQCGLDRVLFVPAAVPPHKKHSLLTPGDVRAEMIALGIAGHEPFAVCRNEIERGGISYTSDTLARFHDEQPDAELFLLLGGDMFHDLPNWHRASQVCRLALPLIVRRPGAGDLNLNVLSGIISPDRLEQVRSHLVEMPEIGISATELRRRVAAGRSIRYQTPRAVEAFIQTHGLYKEGMKDEGRKPIAHSP